jgi:predicted dehydrogenase
MSPRGNVRVAVLGAGAIAQVVHLPILTRMRGVEVAAVADKDPRTARTIAERFGVAGGARDTEDVLADDTVDAVVVCTPSNRHEDNVLEALRAGKFVLCEKPLALTAAGVERVLAEEGAEGRLQVAMNQRFRADARAIRSFVQSGELGEVFYLKAGWLNRAQPRGRTWRESKAAAGGGAFMDLGIQMLDLALWILGHPTAERISAQMHSPAGSEVEDAAALLLRLEGDRVINLEASWNLLSTRDRQFLHVLGSAGSASLTPFAVYREMSTGLTEVTPQLPPGRENLFTASYRSELQHFVEVVRGAQPADSSAREHVQLLRLVEAAYRSAEERQEVVP